MSVELQAQFWFAEEAELAAEGAAARGMAALMGRLHGVKPFPAVARRLLEVIGNPEHDRSEVTRVIEGDPGLATGVLRAINSPVYGLRRVCNSIGHAVALLGSRAIAEIATGMAVMHQFEGMRGMAKEVRAHSLIVANLCRGLAANVPRLARMDLFTCGLLHDLGQLLQLQVDGDGTYEALLAEAGIGPDRVHLLERARLGYDHAVLGAHVLHAWDLPEPLPTAVAWHHQPERAYDANSGFAGDFVAVLRLADQLAWAATADVDDEFVSQLAAAPAASRLGMDVDCLSEIWAELRELGM